MKLKLDLFNISAQGTYFGLLSGFLWACNLTLINHIINFPNSLYELGFISIVIFLFTELYALILLIFYKKNIIDQIVQQKKTLLSHGWFFLICPLGMLCYVIALISMGAENTAIISSIYPVIAVLLSRFILDKKLSFIQYSAIILTAIGIIILSGGIHLDLLSVLGFIFAFSSAMCWGAEAILCDYYFNQKDNIQLFPSELLLAIRYCCSIGLGSIGIILFFIFLKEKIFFTEINLFIFLLKLIPISILSLLSYFCYYQAINKIGAVYAINLNISYMLWVVIFSLFYQSISWETILGASFILFSVITVSLKRNKK
ncbi:hypothetical protein CEP49_01825 [Mergibacter septicus]|uniref:DMT family transporter n=1 Tax=Mergibacter septicus TaxID=221402 RepID=UPI0011798407|nr:DMT family transporter [Mergibacter septicus]AWX13373.1 hypothetical protein CEP49_01825 [Mergibacter septicus]